MEGRVEQKVREGQVRVKTTKRLERKGSEREIIAEIGTCGHMHTCSSRGMLGLSAKVLLRALNHRDLAMCLSGSKKRPCD